MMFCKISKTQHERRHNRAINPRVILEGASFHARVKSGDRRILRGNETNVTFTSKGELPPPRSSAPPSSEGGSIRCTSFYRRIVCKRLQFHNEIISNSVGTGAPALECLLSMPPRVILERSEGSCAANKTNVTFTSNGRIWNPPLR